MADNVSTAWKFLRGKGLTSAQTAGVIGAMQQESGQNLDPKAVNPSSGAMGIAQWLGGRKNAEVTSGNLHRQLNHLWSELQGPESGALSALKQAKDIQGATKAWLTQFERPGANEMVLGRRVANARSVFKQLSGTPGSDSGATTTSSGGDTTTTTTTTPGVDNSAARAQLIQSFLEDRKADPIDLALQIRGLRDVAPTSSTKTTTTPGDPGTKDGKVSLPGGKSPLLELIHKSPTGPGYAVKDGRIVSGPGVYGAVWAGHADHVHVAAGPKTVVELGNLAKKMGLRVSENPHFGGVSAVHVPGSYHYKGEAIDVGGDQATMDRYAAAVERAYKLKH